MVKGSPDFFGKVRDLCILAGAKQPQRHDAQKTLEQLNRALLQLYGCKLKTAEDVLEIKHKTLVLDYIERSTNRSRQDMIELPQK